MNNLRKMLNLVVNSASLLWQMITVSVTEISVILLLVGHTPVRPPPDCPQAPL